MDNSNNTINNITNNDTINDITNNDTINDTTNNILMLFSEIINNRRRLIDNEVDNGIDNGIDNVVNNLDDVTSYFGHINPTQHLNLDMSNNGLDVSSNTYQYFDNINIPLNRRVIFRNNFFNYLNNYSNENGIVNNTNDTTNDNLINNFIDGTLDTAKPLYKKIASEEGIRQIEELPYLENRFSQNMCPIYCMPFIESETICKLPCNHIFSKDGITKWLQESHVCPVCRFTLDWVEVKDISGVISEVDIANDNVDDEMTGIYYNNMDVSGLYYTSSGSMQNMFPAFNLVNILLHQGNIENARERERERIRLEEMEYQEAIIRSIRDT